MPLYPNPGPRLGHDKVATLQGPIETVDGQDVTGTGTFFELLPGCHLVTLLRELGEGNGNAAWSADLPPWIFAFKMKRAHLYSIEVESHMGSAYHGTLVITARERDAAGAVVSEVPPARGPGDIEECKRWQRVEAAAPSVPAF